MEKQYNDRNEIHKVTEKAAVDALKKQTHSLLLALHGGVEKATGTGGYFVGPDCCVGPDCVSWQTGC